MPQNNSIVMQTHVMFGEKKTNETRRLFDRSFFTVDIQIDFEWIWRMLLRDRLKYSVIDSMSAFIDEQHICLRPIREIKRHVPVFNFTANHFFESNHRNMGIFDIPSLSTFFDSSANQKLSYQNVGTLSMCQWSREIF